MHLNLELVFVCVVQDSELLSNRQGKLVSEIGKSEIAFGLVCSAVAGSQTELQNMITSVGESVSCLSENNTKALLPCTQMRSCRKWCILCEIDKHPVLCL